MTKRTKNASQREWPTCSLQCAAQIRPVEVALYWLKLITDQLKVNFFGGISCGTTVFHTLFIPNLEIFIVHTCLSSLLLRVMSFIFA